MATKKTPSKHPEEQAPPAPPSPPDAQPSAANLSPEELHEEVIESAKEEGRVPEEQPAEESKGDVTKHTFTPPE